METAITHLKHVLSNTGIKHMNFIHTETYRIKRHTCCSNKCANLGLKEKTTIEKDQPSFQVSVEEQRIGSTL